MKTTEKTFIAVTILGSVAVTLGMVALPFMFANPLTAVVATLAWTFAGICALATFVEKY